MENRGVNIKAIAWSAGSHLLILLLFFLFRYCISAVQIPADGSGMEVNLGTSESGLGNEQPERTHKPAEYRTAVVLKRNISRDALPKSMKTDPNADEALKQKELEKHSAPTEEVPKEKPAEQQPVPQPKPKLTYNGSNEQGGSDATKDKKGANEGNTKGPGDRGVPGGTPGAASYSGIPGTGGIGHNLTGRKITPDRFEAEFTENGTVVIHVTVDRNGNIISKRVTSSTSPQLTRIALEKLTSAHFSQSESAEPQQFGDVTFYFKNH